MSQWGHQTDELLHDGTFRLLGLTSFLLMTSVPLISPALPAIAESLSVDQARIGLVITAFTLPAIFILPVSGFLADTLGRRQVMSVGCLFIAAGGAIGFFAESFLWLLGGRVVQGIGFAGVMPLTVALLGDVYEDALEDQAQGMRTAAIKAGGVAWPIIGGVLATVSWHYVFVTYLLFLPLSVVLWRGLPDSSVHHESPSHYAHSLEHIVERPRVITYLSIGFVRFFLLYSFFTFLPLLLTSKFSVGQSAVGNYVAVLGVGGLASAMTAGLFSERFRKADIIIAAVFSIGVLSLLLAYTTSLITAVVAVTFVGASEALIGPLHKSLLTENVDAEHRAGVVTLNSVLQNVGKTVGPVVTGGVLLFGDLAWLYAAAALAFGSASAYLAVRRLI